MIDASLHWLFIGALLALSAACAALLRWARPSAADSHVGLPLLGGIMAGVLLGPVIFGRMMPLAFERSVIGGTQERQDRDLLISRQGADLEIANFAHWSPEQIDQLKAQHANELIQADRTLRTARWRDQTPLRIFALLITALVFLGAGAFAVGRNHSSPDQKHLRWVSPLSIGLWSAALPGAIAFAAMIGLWGYSSASAALVAAAVSIGPWALTAFDRNAADQSEIGGARTIQAAGRITALIALAVAAWSMWAQMGLEGLRLALPLAALPIGWIIGRFISGTAAVGMVQHLLVPALAACVTIKIDFFEHFAFWPVIVIVLLSGDGRWLGALVGAVLPDGRRGLRAMRLVLGAMAAGPTQLAVTAIGAHTWAVPENLLVPLLLGAGLIELTAPVRRLIAQRLAQTEADLNDDQFASRS